MSDVKFNITMDTQIDYPQKSHEDSTTFVDEESLLPGNTESRETTGFLPIVHTQQQVNGLEFAPLSEQTALIEQGLKSKGSSLHYELMHNNTLLVATAGDSDIAVFTVYLDQNGAYTFTLHNHLDRAIAPNLLTNDWQKQTDENNYHLNQTIKTQPNEAYHLTFQYQPNHEHHHPIDVYWGNKLLYTLNSNTQTGKGFSFSVEGDLAQETKLQFISQDHDVQHALQNIAVTHAGQVKLPIELSYCVIDQQNETSTHQFTVNVTTTPPILVSSHEPFDVIYDQAVYQTIIVNDDHHAQSTPYTTINLDSLFRNMAIPHENRVVEVVQREDNGNLTNFYEVKISDKSQTLDPITVADVQLSFPGGDGGVSVFHKHITIDEGGSGILPHPDPHFI